MLEGFFEFEAAAAYVLEVGAEEAEFGVDGDLGAGLVDTLFLNEDAAGEDEGLGALAGDGVALIDEEFVEADLWSALGGLSTVDPDGKGTWLHDDGRVTLMRRIFG